MTLAVQYEFVCLGPRSKSSLREKGACILASAGAHTSVPILIVAAEQRVFDLYGRRCLSPHFLLETVTPLMFPPQPPPNPPPAPPHPSPTLFAMKV